MKSSEIYSFDGANASQKEAIDSTEGPVLMIAGPGTGKTFTLVKRIAYLVIEKKVCPSEIMVVTFTEKAAKELLTRISNEFLKYDIDININEMYIGTFHSVCLRILKENSEYIEGGFNYRVLDAFEQVYLVSRYPGIFRSIRGFNSFFNKKDMWEQSSKICNYVNRLMEEMVDEEAMKNDYDPEMKFLGNLISKYKNLFDKKSRLDFASIQTKTFELLEKNPSVLNRLRENIRYIMVDEYQDTNYIQEQLVFLLAGERKNICVVGDDDQGMYRFRGATIRNILEFPQKFKENECKIIHLDTNYRSEKGIIDFYNEWMESPDGLTLFNWNKYRYPKRITAGKKNQSESPSVFSCVGQSLNDEKEKLFHFVHDLMKNGNITDYNQVAFLFRSVKSEEAKEIGEYFEENGIPVYSPRSGLFFEREEVKQIIGCIMSCFASYLISLKENAFAGYISEELRKYYIDCIKSAIILQKQNPQLKEYIDSEFKYINNLSGESQEGYLDIFYHLISFEPFSSYLNKSLDSNVNDTRAARNLSEISRLISRFCFTHEIHKFNEKTKTKGAEVFFNRYIKDLYEEGVREYEDESEYAPHGCVSFMTIHQSKGLEFPVVVVCSLTGKPKKNKDPIMLSAERFFRRKAYEPEEDIAYFDFWRLYYTAFSRAQNLLVLASKSPDSKYFGEYLRRYPDINTFKNDTSFEKVKNVNYKHIYSFTSHISVYDGCPKQYKFYKEYAFAQNTMFQTSVGSLVHATLEDMNKCIINGHIDRVNEKSIEEWFNLNYASMREESGYFLDDEQRENAMNQVIRYYHHRSEELGKVWKAEEEINLIQPDFILQGIIDLIEGQGDTVEIVDYKTGPKPDIEKNPERIEHYRKQLEIYAYLVEERYKKKVSRMHLYYTSTTEGNPIISFDYSRQSIDATISEAAETIKKIESRNFEGPVTNGYACKFCDMKYLCYRNSD